MSTTNQATAMTVTSGAEIVRDGDHALWGEEHMRIVRDAFAPTASPIEFMVMWAGAKSRGLDPVKKQIHFVKRWDDMRGCDVWSSQVSIDGFRAIAEATGKYDGQDEPEFSRDPEDGFLIAKVRVYRKDVGRPFVGVAMWPEFAQTKKNGDPVFMWKKMPYHMLAKCAEALALRKAFPEQLAGLYTPDEMGSDVEPNTNAEKNAAVYAERALTLDPIRPVTPPPRSDSPPAWQARIDAAANPEDACTRAVQVTIESPEEIAAEVPRYLESHYRSKRMGEQAINGWMARYRRDIGTARKEREAKGVATCGVPPPAAFLAAMQNPAPSEPAPGDTAGAAS